MAFTVWDAPLPAFDLFYGAMARYAPSAFPAEDPPLFGVTDPDTLTSALEVADFADTSIARLPVIWQLPSGGALYDALSTLRDFSAVPAPALASFRADVVAGAAKYERDGTFVIPNPVLLISGTRP